MKQFKIEEAVRLFAGCMVLISAALVFFVSKWWLLFTVFIGVNLIQSAITEFCLPEIVFKKMGLKYKFSK
ncbi:MAG: DUF2892 domain-containing protein [Candidatus Omnitrophica bacterium]|nr:DUF2892 domain-containing protein [Candidatus Omnitrophota bacterium]